MVTQWIAPGGPFLALRRRVIFFQDPSQANIQLMVHR